MLRPCYTRPALSISCGLVCCALLLMCQSARAQDFRVVTHVSHRADAQSRWEPIGQSITLFHAGKVYDRMEQLGEVVIFEPAQTRFTILSFKGNNLATTLEFSELQQFLKVARTETESHIQQVSGTGTDADLRRAALRFQLQPHFEESFDPSTKTMTFLSNLLRYEVETGTPQRPRVVQEYLQYADGAAKLNYVLHSRALYPEIRLAVNRSLAERGVIPTEVRLMLDGDPPVMLKAEHKFDWSLSSIDKSTIAKCEKQRTDDKTRWVDFREYQRALMPASGGR